MDASAIQQQLFHVIKTSIPNNLSATDEIARVLEVSADSVYRRLRGEKTISLEELHKLCTHYKISLDQLMDLQTGAFSFKGNLLNSQNFRFDAYLKNALRDVTYMNNFKSKEMYCLCKDIPLFYHFQFREIAAFKYFFWMKTIFHFPGFENQRYSEAIYTDELTQLGEKILDIYNQMPSIEIWSFETFNIALRQIEFYREGHLFESDRDVLKLYDAWGKVIDHIEMQAECGYKFNYADPDRKPMGSYRLYFNEVILGDNNILVFLDDSKMCLLLHTVVNYMATRDVGFCENMNECIQSLMKRSTLISKVSEKERTKFFRILRERIARRKETLRA